MVMGDEVEREAAALIIELVLDEFGLPLPAPGWWRRRRQPN
jgi:hypothetical protein